MNLKGNTIFITGGGSGIGRGLAEAFHKLGNQVIISGRRKSYLDDVITANPGMAAYELDITDVESINSVTQRIVADYPDLNVLVNNAGIMKLAPVAQFEDAVFDQTIAINLKGTFNGLREAATRLRNGGRIINFSSSVVGLYQPTYAVYAATKAAVEAMTHILAKELGSRGITVNAVAPGPVATELFLDGKDQSTLDRIKQMNPLGRLGEVDDIAQIVSLLAGPDSGWINGQVIRANGGVV